LVDLVKISFLCHDKFQLVVIIIQVFLDNWQVESLCLVTQGKLAPLPSPWCGIRQLGTDRDQIAANRFEYRAGRFDRDMASVTLEIPRKRFDFRRQERLTAGDDDVFGGVLSDFSQDASNAPRRALRPPRSIGRITPYAAKIAARRPDEHRWHTNQPTLPLDRIENFTDMHTLKLAKRR